MQCPDLIFVFTGETAPVILLLLLRVTKADHLPPSSTALIIPKKLLICAVCYHNVSTSCWFLKDHLVAMSWPSFTTACLIFIKRAGIIPACCMYSTVQKSIVSLYFVRKIRNTTNLLKRAQIHGNTVYKAKHNFYSYNKHDNQWPRLFFTTPWTLLSKLSSHFLK